MKEYERIKVAGKVNSQKNSDDYHNRIVTGKSALILV